MDLQLKSKTAFISGSTQGIGFAIAAQLLQEGATVWINGRTQDKVDQAITTLKQQTGGEVYGLVADFAEAASVAKLTAALPSIDILVNNVGTFELKPFADIEDADWTRFFEINVMSGVRLSRAVLPHMQQQNWGRIVFISSESGINIPAQMIHYGMTKTAMLSVSNGLSKLTQGTGITVNTILGGPTYSTGVAATVEQIAAAQQTSPEEVKAQLMQAINPNSLLQRFIEPSELASLVTYLCSPLSAATNGAAIRADGGVLNTLW